MERILLQIILKPTVFIVFAVMPFAEGLGTAFGHIWQFLVFIMLVVFHLTLPKARLEFRKYWIWAAVLATFGAVAATFNTSNLSQHLLTAVQILIFMTLGVTALRRIMKYSPRLRLCAYKAFLIGQTTSAIIAILQGVGIGILQSETLTGRSTGLSGHPNVLGLMSAVAVVLSIYGLIKSSHWPASLVVTAGLNILSLLLTGSLSALIAFTAGILVLAFVSRLRLSRLTAYASVLVLTSAAYLIVARSNPSLPNPLDRAQQVTGNTQDIGTWNVRLEVYDMAFSRIMRNPFFGVGMDDTSGLFDHPLDGEVLTHNILIRAWLQGGILLLLSFILIYLSALVAIHKARRYALNGATCSTLAVILTFALTSAAFQQTYFWLLLAAAWSVMEPTSVYRPRRLRSAPLNTQLQLTTS